MKAFWWGRFKGFYSISDSCLAWNLDDLLDNVTGSVGIRLAPKSDESSNDFSNESSEDDENEELDKIRIVFCAIRTLYCSQIASLKGNVSSKYSLALFIIGITSEMHYQAP